MTLLVDVRQPPDGEKAMAAKGADASAAAPISKAERRVDMVVMHVVIKKVFS